MPSLIAIHGPGKGKRYGLEGECILGRSFNSDIYVGDLNVSRRHARIVSDADGARVIEDLGSGNGTFVNDKAIVRHRLCASDVVRIGGSSFRYDVESPARRWSPEVLTVIADIVEPETGDVKLDPATTAQLQRAVKQQENLSGLGQQRAIKMLEAMYAVADAIADELDLARLLDKILAHMFEVFPQAERGFVLLVKADTGQLVPEAVKQRKGGSSGGVKFSQTIVDQVLSQGQGVIRGATIPPEGQTARARPARPALQDDGLLTAGETFRLEEPSPREVPKMGAPLLCRGEALGTLHLEGAAGAKSFSQEDLVLLSAIARQAALAIASARASQALIAQQRLQVDLQMARRIQESFLPQRPPRIAGLEFRTHYVPAQHVGGDFFDIVQITPSQIGILVGDISGKGVSAALLMAKLNTAIRLHAQAKLEPSAVMSHANKTLLETDQDAMFATVLFILLDLEARTFTLANAGHQPPMVCSHRFTGVSELDDATAVALGVVPDMEYPQEVYRVVPGDVVLLYTDGINEAMNRQRKEYGMARLRQIVATGAAAPGPVVERVVADVQRFVGGAPQSDDQTLVAFGLKLGDETDPEGAEDLRSGGQRTG